MNPQDTPKQLWSPSNDFINQTNLSDYLKWLKSYKELSFSNYHELWKWSTDHIDQFWETVWQYFNIQGGEYSSVVSGAKMPSYKWFEGAQVNYAEHIFLSYSEDIPAIISKKEGQPAEETSWSELKIKVTQVQQLLKQWGVQAGDRVVAYVPNCLEATVAFLAVNSLGAIWSSCSPDFGLSSIIDRFEQVKPKVLIGVDGYSYGGKKFDKTSIITSIQKALPSLEHTLLIPYINADISSLDNYYSWNDLPSADNKTLDFHRVPFNDSIWILYSSGTTGAPKAITHSQGGILLEHYKYVSFHQNVRPGDRCFWYTTTGWMMWNYIQSALLCRGTIVLYDGSPAWPTVDALWQMADELRINHFGTSAGYIVANMKEGKKPGIEHNLSSLISIGSTGSPLPPEGFDYVYEHIKHDVWLTSMSGGTDVCSAFVGGVPTLPVYEGEIQARALGCHLLAYNENGEPVTNEEGEMVITQPMPSMPIFFWNDEQHERYKASYFEMYSDVWRHGDWIKITPRHGIIIYGRSDATLNRGGVRIGTSEIYRAVDQITEIQDSLVVCIETKSGDFYMPLFVKMQKDQPLTPELISKVKKTIRESYSPRHVPDEVIAINEIPYTISGKKTETPVKKVLMGKDIKQAMNKDALKNPDAMNFFINLAKELEVG
ncbi:acetoacetate--CoA ligase [Fulvivirga sediminis]|uniref:Acetoacetate--CoA ligase n=1 Tax=Fulvivirga sediminis TaxID=2803949 RepID=A0A937FAS3_9BACT|nr:acetoacetate--CoA ligase [Fulvivirga sediminis]MBL3658486.1 acetoacetate--CoA ligase [Fulvivirga sediminis]